MPGDEEDKVLEDRGDDFVPPGMETEDDPEDEDVEELEDVEDEDDDEESDDEDQEEDDESDDEDEDEDPESEEEDQDEDEEDVEDDEEEQRIPKGRLNQVLQQRDEEREHRRWLEQQLEALIQAQTKQQAVEEDVDEGPPDFDFDAAEEKYVELILEGDTKGATQLRKAINEASRDVYEYQIESAKRAAKSEAVTETTSSLDEVKFNALISEYTESYDFLNDQSDAYNEKAVTMANKLMASYIAEGKSKSAALTAAVKDITPLFGKPEPTQSKKPTTSTRKKTARKKAAKASRQQPPSTKSAKGKADRKWSASDVIGMSEKAFNSLTAREKAKLRGDIV